MHHSSKQSGFTLIELMICLLILALLLSILTLNFGSFTQQAKQIRVLNTARSIGNACMPWLASQGGSASLGEAVDLSDYPVPMTRDEVAALLKPRFINWVPNLDRWGNPWEFYFSGNLQGPEVFVVRSPGRDGVFDGTTYQVGPFVATDYDQDIVWADGNLARWPE